MHYPHSKKGLFLVNPVAIGKHTF